MTALLEFTGVSLAYGARPALRDVSLVVEEGERLAVLGPSGCGKSTLLRLAAGFLAPDCGSIRLAGERVAGEGRIVREPEERNVGMVFQDLALWPHMTVAGNLEFGLRARGVPRAERARRIAEMLALVQLEGAGAARPAELSGGQQQRVALARALVLRPRVLLMDEPLSNLDYELNVRLRGEILGLRNALGFTLVYVTHDREEAFEIAARVLVLKSGAVERAGSVEEIRAHFRSPPTRATALPPCQDNLSGMPASPAV